VGDRVLQALGRILRATSRVGDLLVRYGGDEFVVVPHGGADAARRLAHRVRAGVEAFDWDAIAPGLELTVSVGLGTGGAGADGVLAADEAMLRAKRAGRNQVVEAPTTTQRPDESC
jgi:diguanylate cyclase (GGDEF)-like protein